MKKLLVLSFLVFNFSVLSFSQAYTISTFAGTGSLGFSGDGSAATSAKLFYPYSTSVDAAGNVYIADIDNERIRMVNPGGIISTIAGNGTQGFSGDGGAATSAEINQPTEVYADAAGNIYISGDGRIRIVNTGGVISTFAGNGASGFSGDGGPATAAEFNTVGGVTQDPSGNFYIADGNNHRIRMVNTSGIISSFAGNGTPGYNGDGGPATAKELNYPVSVSTDASGNVYIGDYFNNRVRMVNTSGVISTYAGNGTGGFSGDGGAAASAELDWPDGIFMDNSGNLFISDEMNVRIRMVNSSGIISTIAGNGVQGFSGDGGPATAAEMDNIMGISLDSYGNAYIPDYTNDRIRKLTDVTTGTNNLAIGNGQITVYPNPSNGVYIIEGLIPGSMVQLYDISGKLLETKINAEAKLMQFDLSNFADGMYLLRIISKEGKVLDQKKVLKN